MNHFGNHSSHLARSAAQSLGLRVKIYFKDGRERVTKIVAFFFMDGEYQIWTNTAGDHPLSAVDRIEQW